MPVFIVLYRFYIAAVTNANSSYIKVSIRDFWITNEHGDVEGFSALP